MSRSPGMPRRKERRHERAIVQRKTRVSALIVIALRVGDAGSGADRAALADPRGRGAPRHRQQPGPCHRPARNRGGHRADRSNPHGLHAGVLDRAGTIERRHAAGELSARRARRRCRRLVLVDRCAAAIAVGIRDVERLVGYVEDRDEQPVDAASIPRCNRDSSSRSRSRCSAIARSTRHGINTRSPSETRAARTSVSARPSSRPWPP